MACGAGTAEVEDVAGASELVPDEAVAEDVVAEEAAAVEPVLLVVPGSVRQGETALVRLSGVEAASAFVTVAGFTVPMVAEGGAWLGYLPIPPLSPLGSSTVVVDLFDGAGAYQDTSLGQVDGGGTREPWWRRSRWIRRRRGCWRPSWWRSTSMCASASTAP